MTIASEITRIQTNIANAYDALEAKGATMPATENSANLSATVATISAGGDTISVINNTGTVIHENDKVWVEKDKQNFTILGSPTINTETKIVSGFNSSSCIQVGTLPFSTANSWEIQLKIKTGSNVTSPQYIFVEDNTSYCSGILVQSGKIHFQPSSSHSSFLFTLSSSTIVSTNTDYIVKVTFTGTDYNLYIDGTLEATHSMSTKLLSWTWNIGSARGGNTYSFDGSVYLDSNTFINIDGSSYWVPYILGYSANNYATYGVNGTTNVSTSTLNPDGYLYFGNGSQKLELPEIMPVDTADTWEINTKIYIQTSNTNGMVISDSNDTYSSLFIYTGNGGGKPVFEAKTVGGTDIALVSPDTIPNRTPYWIKCKFTGTAYEMYTSLDGVTYTLKASQQSSSKVVQTNHVLRMGSAVSTSTFYLNGRIYLTDTNIKINGQLWWDGVNIVSYNNLPFDALTGFSMEDIATNANGDVKTLLE